MLCHERERLRIYEFTTPPSWGFNSLWTKFEALHASALHHRKTGRIAIAPRSELRVDARDVVKLEGHLQSHVRPLCRELGDSPSAAGARALECVEQDARRIHLRIGQAGRRLATAGW